MGEKFKGYLRKRIALPLDRKIWEKSNVHCVHGTLKRGVGLLPYCKENGTQYAISGLPVDRGTYVVPVKEEGIEKQVVYLLGVDGRLYLWNEEKQALEAKAVVGENVTHVVIKDEENCVFTMFAGTNAAVYTINGINFYLISSGNYVGSCACGGRYFLAKETEVEYSDTFIPYRLDGSSDEGGVFYAPAGYGKIVGICEDGGYAYLFLQRGVFRINPSATGREFFMKRLPYAGGEICARSMVSVGQGALFLSTTGCYRAIGERIEKGVEGEFLPSFPEKICSVDRCGGWALIDYYEHGETEKVARKRIALSADGKEWFYTDRQGVLAGTGYCYFNKKIYAYWVDGKQTEYFYSPFAKTKNLDFGTDRVKTLKSMRLRGRGSVIVEVRTGRKTDRYSLTFERGEGELRLFQKGRKFSFQLIPATLGEVEELSVEYVYGEQ